MSIASGSCLHGNCQIPTICIVHGTFSVLPTWTICPVLLSIWLPCGHITPTTLLWEAHSASISCTDYKMAVFISKVLLPEASKATMNAQSTWSRLDSVLESILSRGKGLLPKSIPHVDMKVTPSPALTESCLSVTPFFPNTWVPKPNVNQTRTGGGRGWGGGQLERSPFLLHTCDCSLVGMRVRCCRIFRFVKRSLHSLALCEISIFLSVEKLSSIF